MLTHDEVEKAVIGAYMKPEGVHLPVAEEHLTRVRGWVVGETLRQGWTYTTRYDRTHALLHVTVAL